jgi:hypothetical protein
MLSTDFYLDLSVTVLSRPWCGGGLIMLTHIGPFESGFVQRSVLASSQSPITVYESQITAHESRG